MSNYNYHNHQLQLLPEGKKRYFSSWTIASRLPAAVLLCFLGLTFIGVLPQPTKADVMTNNNYNIDTENISIDNILHNNTQEPIIRPGNPIQTKPEESYQIESDFAKSSLSFSISQDFIDLGSISSTDPVIRENQISLTNTIGGYQVLAFEDHPLTATTSATIPDTTCDNGSCSSDTPAEWSSALTYGFGYRCDNIQGTPCISDFLQPDYYSPFANMKLHQDSAAIMQSPLPVKDQQAQITYKVVISGTQQSGNYTNTITYLAVPGF